MVGDFYGDERKKSMTQKFPNSSLLAAAADDGGCWLVELGNTQRRVRGKDIPNRKGSI